MKQAVELALAGSIRPGVSAAAVQTFAARAERARADLLPSVAVTVNEQNVTRNLAAEGFRFPTGVPGFTIPNTVGPFRTTDARISASYNVLDLSARKRAQAQAAEVRVMQADVQLTRRQVASEVALLYLAALRAQSAIEDATASAALSEAVSKSVSAKEQAGKATALDVTRAGAQAAQDKGRIAIARAEWRGAALRLLDALGAELDSPLELTDSLENALPVSSGAQEAIQAARRQRADFQVQRARLDRAALSQEAASLQWIPSVSVYGDVGALGGYETHVVGIGIRVPLLDSKRRNAERAEAAAVLRQEELRGRALDRQVALDVQLAWNALETARLRLTNAAAMVELHEQELAQAQRRYDAGVAVILDLIASQDRLVRARSELVEARYRCRVAEVTLNQAIGM